MKNIRDVLSENFQFLEVKCSIYLNSHVFVMFLFRNTILYNNTEQNNCHHVRSSVVVACIFFMLY